MTGAGFFPAHRDTIREGESYAITPFVYNELGAPLLRSSITNWSIAVYDVQSVAEATAVYSATGLSASAQNADGSYVFSASTTFDALARHPMGRTMAYKNNPEELFDGRGGRTYAYEIAINCASNGSTSCVVVRADLAITPRYG